MKIVVATSNKGKLEEFKRILEPLSIEAISPSELGIEMHVDETGEAFSENARIKAKDLFEKTGLPTVADDSGLCVDAMGGRPGVKTARYAGADSTYAEKFAKMLGELDGVPKNERTAAFVCGICCVLDESTMIETVGSCEGWIGFEPEGDKGFGYDPIFYVGEHSLATFDAKKKDAISHRGEALRKFVLLLKKHMKNRGEK